MLAWAERITYNEPSALKEQYNMPKLCIEDGERTNSERQTSEEGMATPPTKDATAQTAPRLCVDAPMEEGRVAKKKTSRSCNDDANATRSDCHLVTKTGETVAAREGAKGTSRAEPKRVRA